jgi:hypothetical protein
VLADGADGVLDCDFIFWSVNFRFDKLETTGVMLLLLWREYELTVQKGLLDVDGALLSSCIFLTPDLEFEALLSNSFCEETITDASEADKILAFMILLSLLSIPSIDNLKCSLTRVL